MTELEAINRMLAAIGQAPVNSVDQSNPDVAICSRTLKQVSQEVQSEGWTFNKVINYSFQPDIDEYIYIRPVNTDPSSDYILQMDLSHNTFYSRDKQAVARSKGSSVFLYDMLNNNFQWGTQPVEVDIIYYISNLSNIPPVAQNYIIDRASAMVSMQTVGDVNQFSILSTREQYSRAQLLEYETSQGDYTFFGHAKGSNYYNSYQPFHTLSR
jgi:hypothetical protein